MSCTILKHMQKANIQYAQIYNMHRRLSIQPKMTDFVYNAVYKHQ